MKKVVYYAESFNYSLRFKSDAMKHLKHRKKQSKFKTNKKAMVNYRQLNDDFPYRNGYMINRDKNNDRLIRVYRYKSSESEYKSGRRRRLNMSYMKDDEMNISQISNSVWKNY